MKRMLLLCGVWILGACASPTPEVIYIDVTATPKPVTATRLPTSTLAASPTSTKTPTLTPVPRWPGVELEVIEQALREARYRRSPFSRSDGVTGYYWTAENAYEQVTTWSDGVVRLEVLNDAPAADRLAHMERKFAVLDRVLPTGLMADLREEYQAYNRSVERTVSGEPDWVEAYGGEWKVVNAEYNTETVNLGGYEIVFLLRWWQATCPPQYLYCYYDGFPGLEFTGDSSFIFQSVLIFLPSGGAPSASSGGEPSTSASLPDQIYLSELTPASEQVGHKSPSIGYFSFTSPGDGVTSGDPIVAHGTHWAHGIYAHANSRYEFYLNGNYSELWTSLIMLERMRCGNGVVFIVRLDGRELYRSPRMDYNSDPVEIRLEVAGGERLELLTDMRGDVSCDWSIWGDPILYRDPQSQSTDPGSTSGA